MVFKYGESKRESNDGLVVLGTEKPFTKLAPGRITLESSSDRDEKLPCIVKGITSEGKGVSEFITVTGSKPVQSKETFTYINEIVVNSRNDNQGTLIAKDAAGDVCSVVKPFDNKTNVCFIYATKPYKILSWGVGVEGDEALHSATGRLTIYDKDKRLQIHKLTVTQHKGEANHSFADMHLKEGQILVVEIMSGKYDDVIHGWFELLEE